MLVVWAVMPFSAKNALCIGVTKYFRKLVKYDILNVSWKTWYIDVYQNVRDTEPPAVKWFVMYCYNYIVCS